ncbi:AIR synthase family protein [Halocatena pleomorpha]|uniref:Hydrogenase expression protein n=1 Tax=Halocatena pleomorpha TaxID=1785090 RepID=A0A3P3RFJ3_9EURY|nr:AIR synthase family protein [Halocatena pleomorpha]RRJ32202.1 hydrogenase expression protein [Halocatena pleomorpha]
MPDYGKIDRGFFEEYIHPNLGASREDVRLGPTPGVDFGVIDVNDSALVVATDPISILPALGFERAARFALNIVLADVAVSGFAPQFLSISFTLPPSMTDAEFGTLWSAIDDAATELGVSVVTGHTARYEGCEYPWIGSATAFAVGDHDDIIRPDGTQPGDQVIVTTGPAVEAVGLLTTLFGDRMSLPEDTIATAKRRLSETNTVRDALTAGELPVTAIHDATEGGLQGGLTELAASSGLRLEIDSTTVPTKPAVDDVCAYLDIEPWHATSSGTLLITAPKQHADRVVAALHDRGTDAAVVGTAHTGRGVYVDGTRVRHPETDPSWAVYAEYATDP